MLRKIDTIKGQCIFQGLTHFHIVTLEMTFPRGYPKRSPDFVFLKETTLNQVRGQALIRRMKNIADHLCSQGFNCIDNVLKVYEEELAEIMKEEEKDAVDKKGKSYRDSNVPYPRISGARFCGRGQLVIFRYSFARPVSFCYIFSTLLILPKKDATQLKNFLALKLPPFFPSPCR